MEKTSAACAMEWSIELEKALRSKKPGEAIKAIKQIGERLQQWSKEPKPTISEYKIFFLELGEDRLFYDTILLRLADAFKLGDNYIRRAIVRIFLLEFRNGKKGKRYYEGILSKDRVHNPSELLRRVKTVFDTGDVESRALALVLFGCWADFSKDSAHIRYLILSSLVSTELLEVKSSVFAAGCLCELAADFASIVFEMFVNSILSPETPLTVRLAGARVFPKMGSAYFIANNAYKIGLKLVLESSEEQFLAAMLVSLTKLATNIFLLSGQVDLLLSFLSSGRSLRLQAIALRCLHFIFVYGVCHPPINLHIIRTISRITDEIELPSIMHCEALQILQKMLVYGLPELSSDMFEFTLLLNIIEKAANSPTTPKSLLAYRLLVDVSAKLRARIQIGSERDHFLARVRMIISVVMDRIFSLVKPLLDVCQNNSKAYTEFQSLLNLLIFLIREHPDLGILVFEKLRSFVEYLVDKLHTVVVMQEGVASVNELVDLQGSNCIDSSLILVCGVIKFSARCMENLYEVSTITNEILDGIQSLVDCVQRCRLFDCYIQVISSVLLHSHIIWSCVLNSNAKYCNLGGDLGNSLCNKLIAHQMVSLEYIEKMMAHRDSWPAYRAGKFAASQGAWFTAAFIFGQLIDKAKSNSCSSWLKVISQFSQSEVKIQLFQLPNLGSSLVDWLQNREIHATCFLNGLDKIPQVASGDINGSDHRVFVEAYHDLSSSMDMLDSVAILNYCSFQRWFLGLRVKVLSTVVNTLEVLGNIAHIKCDVSNNREVDKSITAKCIISLRQMIPISFQLRSLAEEFDLIAMSFIGMDATSSNIISAHALSCSLLAFTTGFFLFISNLPHLGIITCDMECSRNYLLGMLVHNLVGPLQLIDQETCSMLFHLSKLSEEAYNSFHLHSRNPMPRSGCEAMDIVSVCRYAVSGVYNLQNETKGMPNEELLSHVTQHGSQLLLKTITKWMKIPFRVPQYFFKLRPCTGSELFACTSDTRYPKKITLLRGSHLALNLCLCLRNLRPDLTRRMKNLYCILCCNESFQGDESKEETSTQKQWDYQSCVISSMVAMNKKLLTYVTECAKKTGRGKCIGDCNSNSNNNDTNVYEFVCFEINAKGQGFSNCLLDVSKFPVGSYRIKWHSCLIDNLGSYWSLLPLNAGPVFTVTEIPV